MISMVSGAYIKSLSLSGYITTTRKWQKAPQNIHHHAVTITAQTQMCSLSLYHGHNCGVQQLIEVYIGALMYLSLPLQGLWMRPSGDQKLSLAFRMAANASSSELSAETPASFRGLILRERRTSPDFCSSR